MRKFKNGDIIYISIGIHSKHGVHIITNVDPIPQFKIDPYIEIKNGTSHYDRNIRLASDEEIKQWIKANKVAVHVASCEEVKQVDKFLDNDQAHHYLYSNLIYESNQCINTTDNCYTEKQWYLDNGYTVITTQQLLQNQKQMENKKIIGYKCIKAYPGNNLGTIATTSCDYFEYPEYWEPQYEEEFKVGDWVFDIINKTCGQINRFMDSNACVFHKQGATWIKQLRKATPEEIKAVVETVKISSYECKFNTGNIEFGCAVIPNDVVRSLSMLTKIAEKSGFSFDYNKYDGLRIAEEKVSSEKLDRIIQNLKD